MGTPGIENVYDKIQDLVGRPVYPLDIDAIVNGVKPWGSEAENTSLLQQFLRLQLLPTLESADAALLQALLEALHYGWVSKAGPDMLHGCWDHFKGGVYLSEKVVNWVEDGEPLVIYLSLLHGTYHARRCAEWNEVVAWPDGRYRSRFVYRGKTLAVDPPSFKVPK